VKFIELFAGIGGFRYGLESVIQSQGTRTRVPQCSQPTGDSTDSKGKSRKDNAYTCVWANEWDKYACQIYRKNYGEGELYEGDITKVNADDIPDHDLLTGGFPCQAFSIAGKRLGFNDTRGTLFFEIARILKAKRPKYLLLENVKGLLSHDNGRTFKTILSTLDELGYDLQWQVLNSKNFGVPQNRERVFIIGHLRGERRPEVFPIGEGKRENDKTIAHALNSSDWRGANRNQKQNTIRTDKPNTQETGNKPNNTNTIRRTPYTNDMRIRRLTPTECERLQGFPDGWTEGVSDSQRYKALGNAVTTNVITAIGERIALANLQEAHETGAYFI
jgi:DNA (cytosine-5)-methyltransferase 1